MKRYVFVCGCPRSGTTALWRLLMAHEKVCIGNERYYRVFTENKPITKALYDRDAFYTIREGETFYNELPRRYESKYEKYNTCQVLGDKVPYAYLRYSDIIESIPEARFVFVSRNIFDVAVSYNSRAHDTKDKDWPESTDYQVAVQDWNESLHQTLKHREHVPLHVVEYEDLYSTKENVRDIFSFLDLNMTASVEEEIVRTYETANELAQSKTRQLSAAEKRFICKNADFDTYRDLAFPPGSESFAATAKGLLRNGSFESWHQSTPNAWGLLQGAVKRADNKYDGCPVVQFEPREDKAQLPMLHQTIKIDSRLRRGKICLSVDARSHERGVLSLNFNLDIDGEKVKGTTSHVGDSEWEELRHEINVSEGALVGSIQVLIQLREQATEPAWVANAKVTICE